MEGFPEIRKAIEQFDAATALRGNYNIEGKAAQLKATDLRKTGQTLSRLIVQPLGMTGPHDTAPTYSPLTVKRAFHERHPSSAHDFFERLRSHSPHLQTNLVRDRGRYFASSGIT
jgi:hypothetical protein